jgi:hypothetical protein
MQQEVKYIKIKDLVLWTENPRDPINPSSTDQDVVDRVFTNNSKWKIDKLSREMGEFYDFSELPTVVFHENKPVVYDGNRRIVLGKIKLGYVGIPQPVNFSIPSFPEEIPCNVCDEETALKNIYRKHSDSGSWQPLERDIFLNKFMKQDKSPFLLLEEETKLISTNPHLNQRFVKEEVLKPEILEKMGFYFKDGNLLSVHSNKEAAEIFNDISNKVQDKIISTRKNRGNIVEVLNPDTQKIIDQNSKNNPQKLNINSNNNISNQNLKRQSKRISAKELEFFGGKLFLKASETSNLYRDIFDLHIFYSENKSKLSNSFTGLIRMSLRLLCETAAKEDNNKKLENYLKGYFGEAKKMLSQDIKTTLSGQNVTEESIIQLLHTGAHNYKSTNDMAKTLALSIIIGKILTLSHGK